MSKMLNYKSIISIILVISFLSFFWQSFDYSQHTKAICDQNVCRDYLVTCENNEIVNIIPVSGFVVFDYDWQDKRTDEKRKITC